MDIKPFTAVIQNWALTQVSGRSADAPGAVGQIVLHGNGGQTTAIDSVDADHKTVTTINGSVYALGVPNLGYAIRHPGIMAELGM